MKKFVLGLLLGILFLVLLPTPTQAQIPAGCTATNNCPQRVGISKDNYDTNGDVNSVILSSDMITNDMYNASCLVGMADACTNDPNKFQSYFNKSFLGVVNNSIASLYTNPPASTREYIAYLGQQAGFVRPAYAQGIGFTGLSPLLGLWTGFRNISYGFLIIVTGAIGFMILFRMKIDPRTVITIQSALPRIVVALIVITFSYAIVGILIDLMYIVMFLVLSAVTLAIGNGGNLQNVISFYTGGSTGDLFSAVFAPSGASLEFWKTEGAVGDILALFPPYWLNFAGAIVGGLVTHGWWTRLVGIGFGATEGPNALVHLLVGLAFLIAFVRILFTLLNAYISVLVAVIFGPLQLMFGAIPNNDSITSWFKNLLANLAVFPVVSTLLLLAFILANDLGRNPQMWRPPGLAGNIVGSGVARGIGGIIGMGMVFIIPNIAGALKEMLKAKSPLPVGLGAAASPLTGAWGTATSGLSSVYYFGQMRQMFPWIPGFGKK